MPLSPTGSTRRSVTALCHIGTLPICGLRLLGTVTTVLNGAFRLLRTPARTAGGPLARSPVVAPLMPHSLRLKFFGRTPGGGGGAVEST